MTIPNRVCLKSGNGYKGARFARQYARSGDIWVPIPAPIPGLNTLLLIQADELRPCGVHPADYYGWPRERADTRYDWTLETEEQFAIVHAHTLEGAIRESGFPPAAIVRAEQHAFWF